MFYLVRRLCLYIRAFLIFTVLMEKLSYSGILN